jgi:hypothetical protein
MLIKVIYKNSKFDMVKPFYLDKLILEDEIKMFLRSGKWVAIGVDPLRGPGGLYKGTERRGIRKNVIQSLRNFSFKPFLS